MRASLMGPPMAMAPGSIASGWRGRAALVGLFVLASCHDEPPATVLGPDPVTVVESAAVTPGPQNVLSAVVTARVRGADSVAVRYGPPGSALDSVTPAVVTPLDSFDVPVLGLLPGTLYEFRVVAYAGRGTTWEIGRASCRERV